VSVTSIVLAGRLEVARLVTFISVICGLQALTSVYFLIILVLVLYSSYIDFLV